MTTTSEHTADTPACSAEGHGPMVPRPVAGQTYEQQFCGIWYDCGQPRCRNSRLLASRELADQLAGASAL